MGQKTNPISNRIGITRGWDSNWVGLAMQPSCMGKTSVSAPSFQRT